MTRGAVEDVALYQSQKTCCVKVDKTALLTLVRWMTRGAVEDVALYQQAAYTNSWNETSKSSGTYGCLCPEGGGLLFLLQYKMFRLTDSLWLSVTDGFKYESERQVQATVSKSLGKTDP